MRETCTYGSMRGSRRKTAKSVLRVVEDRAGVPDNKGRSALLYTPRNARFTGLSAISTHRMTSELGRSPAKRLFPGGR